MNLFAIVEVFCLPVSRKSSLVAMELAKGSKVTTDTVMDAVLAAAVDHLDHHHSPVDPLVSSLDRSSTT